MLNLLEDNSVIRCGDIIVIVVGWKNKCSIPWSLVLKQMNGMVLFNTAYKAQAMRTSAELHA